MQNWDLKAIEAEPHQPQILASADDARTIVLLLPAGEELQEHEVHEHAWLHVHDGTVEVQADGAARQIGAGGLVHWAPQERHEVRAVQDALLLLMLAPWPGPGHPNLHPGS
ncbi:MAG TPA: cupin domain-containing protein [Solirubrobacterales bacterium]|nr:cupin domain-containing protein [Solirubrobacterales bacterium]